MGHTDVVPVNADGWRHDPFGGELIDGEVWGRGAVDMLNLTASMAVASKHLADVRVPPEGHAHLPRASPTRRPSAPTAPTTSSSTSATPSSPTTSSPSPAASRCRASARACKLPVIVGEKGSYWCTLRVTRHAGARVAAVPHRQRAGEGGRGRAPPRRVPARDADPRHLAPLRRGHRPAARGRRRPLLDPDRLVDAVRRAAARHGPPVPRLHAHDLRADDRPRRHEDQRDPRHGRPRGRHPHAARPGRAPRCERCSTRRSATSSTRSSSSSSTTTGRRRRRSTRRCGTR